MSCRGKNTKKMSAIPTNEATPTSLHNSPAITGTLKKRRLRDERPKKRRLRIKRPFNWQTKEERRGNKKALSLSTDLERCQQRGRDVFHPVLNIFHVIAADVDKSPRGGGGQVLQGHPEHFVEDHTHRGHSQPHPFHLAHKPCIVEHQD